jgi:hypothetical protein
MNNSRLVFRFALIPLVIVLVPMAQAVMPARASKAVDTKAPAVSLREVGYESLETKIGSPLVIRTTNDTTRRGTLLRYTKVSLNLKLGPENGSIDLAIPRDTIRKIMIEIAPADPLFLDEKSMTKGKPGAKTN